MKNENPRFSIITVVYNCVASIEETIRSVIDQEFSSFEYIIIDGGSTDGTLDVIRQYQSHLSFWLSERDNGIYHAMNKGLDSAKGEWINFLNSGDKFTSAGILDQVSSVINDNNEMDVIYGDISVFKNGVKTERIAGKPGNKHRMYFCHQSAFVKANVMRTFRFDESFRLSSDFLFFKQCYYAKNNFLKIEHVLVCFDVNGLSNTQRIKGLLENIEIVKRMDKFPVKLLFLARLYFVVFWNLMRHKN